MDKKITNKIVSLDNIIYIADIMRRHDIYYAEIEEKEKQKKEEAKARDEHYFMKFVSHETKFSVTFNNNENVSKDNDLDWFINTITSDPKSISSICVHYYASFDEQRESTTLYFYQNKVDFDCSTTNMSSNSLAEQIEQFINSLPPRYDETIIKDSRRTMIPVLSISIPVGLVVAMALLIISRLGVLAAGVANVLNNGFLLTGAFLLIAFFGALIIPTENTSLYKHIKFETYYAGHDKNYKSIYKNDYADFKNKCEVEIGENVEMPKVRRKINSNYKKAIKIVKIELIISLIGIVLFFVL